MAGRSQSSAIVCIQVIDQLYDVGISGNRLREDSFPGEIVYFAGAIGFFVFHHLPFVKGGEFPEEQPLVRFHLPRD